MKYIFNIFTILKSFIMNMIISMVQNANNLLLESYYVNYKFTTIDNAYRFELPIIFEVNDIEEMNMLNQRMITEIGYRFSLTHSSPIKINEHKKLSIQKEKVALADSEVKANVRFVNSTKDLTLDENFPPQEFYVKVVSMKRPKRYGKEVSYPLSTIRDFFVFRIPTKKD